MSQTGIRDHLPVVTEKQLLALPGLEPHQPGRGQLVSGLLDRVRRPVWDRLIKEWSAGGPEAAFPTSLDAVYQAEPRVLECLQKHGRAGRINKTGSVFFVLKVEAVKGDGEVTDVRVMHSDFDDRVINACVMVGLTKTKFPRPTQHGIWYPLITSLRVFSADEWEERLRYREHFGRIKRDAASD